MNPARPVERSGQLDLSAIVITRNEEGNIEDVIQAILTALDRARALGVLSSYEVILVDSASTDQTVNRARHFPIHIVRLRPSWPLSAGAGRATGCRIARGRFFLFVDGDYIIEENWLPIALNVMHDSTVAGVCGVDLEEITGHTVLAQRWAQAQSVPPKGMSEIDAIPVGIVRRSSYEHVGGLNPFLKGGEDRDLAFRLLEAGWHLFRTAEPMGTHRFASAGHPMTYLEYYRSVAFWSLGDGQACRMRWPEPPLRRRFLRRYATARFLIHDLQLLGVLVLLLAHLFVVLTSVVALFALLLTDVALLLMIRRWGRLHNWDWRETFYELQGLIYGPFRQAFFAIGFLKHTAAAEQYPRDFEVVQTNEVPHHARN